MVSEGTLVRNQLGKLVFHFAQGLNQFFACWVLEVPHTCGFYFILA